MTTAVPAPVGAPSPRDRRTARLLVAGQFVLLAVIVLLPGADAWTLPSALIRAARLAEVVGLLIIAVGAIALGRGLTAAPLPNARAELRTGGLYRIVRHPIYTGLLLFALARTLMSDNWWTVAACAALFVLINGKARWEEQHLAARFPGYSDYAATTPRFVPGWPTKR